MRHIVIAATAAVALAAGAFAASAQQDEEQQRPQAQSQSKKSKQSPSASEKGGSPGKQLPRASAQDKPKESQQRAEPRSSKATDKGGDRALSQKRDEPARKHTEQRDRGPAPKIQDKSTAQAPKFQDKATAPDKSEAPKKSTAQRKDDDASKESIAQSKGDDASKKSTAQSKGDDASKKSTAQSKGDDASKKSTAERKDDDGQKKAVAGKDSQDKKQAQDGKGQRVELSQDQRTRVRTTIVQQNVKRVTNVNFSINLGTRVPRTVALHVLPRTVVEIVPYYRDYRYFVVEDRICIVDPATYEIVYIIDDSGPRVRTAGLVLTDSERRFILSQLDVSRPTADIRLRLALGAEIPNRVELLAFPDRIVTRVPKVREFRYVIADRSVAIVDPDDREVVLVIEA